MFTGIVEEVGRVKYLKLPSQGVGAGRLTIGAEVVLEGLETGGSIAVNGACLTVVALDNCGFSVDLAPETLRRTNLGSLGLDSGVDLERPLMATARLGGHIVQGHVDATGTLISIKPGRGLHTYEISGTEEAHALHRNKGFRCR